MQIYPNVKLRIISGFSGHVQDWLQRGKIDLGVAYEGQQSNLIKAQPIIIEKLFFIQSAAKGAQDGVPIDAHTALQQTLILPNPEHGLRAPQRGKGAGHMGAGEAGNVGADDTDRRTRKPAHRADRAREDRAG